MTVSDWLDQIDAREAAATTGPWTPHYASNLHDDAAAWIGAPGVTTAGLFVASVSNTADGLNDATFIAAARTDVPALVAALREARAESEGLRKLAGNLGGELAAARAQVEAVRALHSRVPAARFPYCAECKGAYPCATVRAIGGGPDE